jgi:opacity protein-like surface antigen
MSKYSDTFTKFFSFGIISANQLQTLKPNKMKKNILLVAAVAVLGLSASAQKPTEGNNSSLEVGLNIGENGGETFTAPSLRYRYFIAPNMAVRFGLSLDGTKSTETFYENADYTGATGTQEIKGGSWSVSPGFEYHFAGTDKLSPYAGVSLMFGGGSSEETWTNFDGTGYSSVVTAGSITSKESMMGWGIVFGCDFYFAENIFVGAEFGYMGWGYTDKGGETSITAGGTTVTSTVPADTWKSGGRGFGANAGIRLGWRF